LTSCATADRRIADSAAAQAGLEAAQEAVAIAAQAPAIETLPGDCRREQAVGLSAQTGQREALLRLDHALTAEKARRRRCVELADARIAEANARSSAPNGVK
jgi:hypothetical protein